MNEHPVIQTLNRTCVEAAQALIEQPDFFAELRDEMPFSDRELVQQHGVRYSGQRSDDESTNLLVGAMRLLGCSDRAIERKAGVDRRTIPFRLAWLEKRGRIPALKARLLTIVGEVAESSGIVLTHLLAQAIDDPSNSDLAAMLRAVGTVNSFAVQQTQLLTGAPTEIVEHRPGAGRAEIERFWKESGVVIDVDSAAVDSASTGKPAEPATLPASELARHGDDTATGDLAPADGPSSGRAEGGRWGSPAGGRVEKVNGSEGLQNSSQGGHP